MKRISSTLAALAVVVACTGIAFATSNPGAEKPPKETTVTYPITALGGSGQHGTVTLKTLSATQTQVTISIVGEPVSAIQPAHIHTGSCPTPGAVKWPLTNVVHGASVTTLDVPFSQVNASGFAVNIHKSAAAIATYKACGNILGT